MMSEVDFSIHVIKSAVLVALLAISVPTDVMLRSQVSADDDRFGFILHGLMFILPYK